MRLLPLLLLLSFPAAAEQVYSPRVFDVVAPAGREVQRVGDQTVLRLPGTAYGAVLTFLPESDTQAWIPLAVLNTGTAELKVGTQFLAAEADGAPLKIWSPTALVRWHKDGRTGLPPAPTLAARPSRRADGGALSLHTTVTPVAPTPPPTIGPVEPGTQTQTTTSQMAGMKNSISNDAQREMDARRDALDAMRDRLFRDGKIAPREVARGDVLVALPPRGTAGSPAEFVLTLGFGGERIDVRYRERLPDAAAGDVPGG